MTSRCPFARVAGKKLLSGRSSCTADDAVCVDSSKRADPVPPKMNIDKNGVKKRPLKRGQATEATIEEFERENMGIAPKE
jgi:hypothetical protein